MRRNGLFAWHSSQIWCSLSITTALKNLKEAMLFLDGQQSTLWSEVINTQTEIFQVKEGNCMVALWEVKRKEKSKQDRLLDKKSAKQFISFRRFSRVFVCFLLHKILILPYSSISPWWRHAYIHDREIVFSPGIRNFVEWLQGWQHTFPFFLFLPRHLGRG